MTIRSYMVAALVPDERVNVEALQALARVEERELDDGGDAEQRRVQPSNQSGGSGGSAARCEHVVDEQDLVGRADGVVMNLQDVRAVLEHVLMPSRRPRQLPRL